MLLTAFAPWVLPWLLIVGGAYLCFEGAEKVLEWFGFHHGGHDGDEGGRDEKRLVLGAVRTDLILSTEIMLIGLSNVDPDLDFWRASPSSPSSPSR
jgi:predicted DNA repair protein MutK